MLPQPDNEITKSARIKDDTALLMRFGIAWHLVKLEPEGNGPARLG